MKILSALLALFIFQAGLLTGRAIEDKTSPLHSQEVREKADLARLHRAIICVEGGWHTKQELGIYIARLRWLTGMKQSWHPPTNLYQLDERCYYGEALEP